jgi:hypothetical protein
VYFKKTQNGFQEQIIDRVDMGTIHQLRDKNPRRGFPEHQPGIVII